MKSETQEMDLPVRKMPSCSVPVADILRSLIERKKLAKFGLSRIAIDEASCCSVNQD